ncbi:MAG TPA: SRPBCC family protein [Ktedonobacterales bacterium]|jgi:uncharacterized protein YndB with AHSA1/START domain|nr:SRPBCC family protein [Ktedonobacterales bacterium]
MGNLEIIAEPGTQQILMSREFDAPAALVFRAYTEPELLVQWLGPRNMTMRIDRYENWDGGYWRFVHTDESGKEAGFHGVMHGTPSPAGVTRTFEYEGYPGHVSLETLTFEEHDGKTRIRTNSVFQSVEDRDGMVQSGMESGAIDSMEKLDGLLARLKAEQQATQATQATPKSEGDH